MPQERRLVTTNISRVENGHSKTVITRIGYAYVQPDGSIHVTLEALPISGTMLIQAQSDTRKP